MPVGAEAAVVMFRGSMTATVADEQLAAENHKLSVVNDTEQKIAGLEDSKGVFTTNLSIAQADYNIKSGELKTKREELELIISRKEKILSNEAGIKKALEEMDALKLYLSVTVLEAKTKKAEIENEISQSNLQYQALKTQYDTKISEINTRYDKQSAELEKEFTAKQSEYQLKLF